MMKRALLILLLATTYAQASSLLTDPQRGRLEKKVSSSFDQRTVPADSIEYALLRASQGDPLYRERVQKALKNRKPTSAIDLRLFSLAYWFLRSEKDLEIAQKLSKKPNADVEALATFYESTGDKSALAKAIAKGNQLSMTAGSSFLSLYRVTGDRLWLKKAKDAADQLNRAGRTISSARFNNDLYQYVGETTYQKMARDHFLASTVASSKLHWNASPAEVLLVDRELTNDPIHITIVGGKKDPVALALFQAALRYPAFFKRLEWWDKSEGPMPNPDVQYPTFPKAAAFACSKKSCSFPIFEPSGLETAVNRLKTK